MDDGDSSLEEVEEGLVSSEDKEEEGSSSLDTLEGAASLEKEDSLDWITWLETEDSLD